jgi:hypothetical protein
MTHRGGPLNPGRGTVTRQEAGRICQEPACDTRLSIYNSALRCSVHEIGFFRPVLAPRPVGAAIQRG